MTQPIAIIGAVAKANSSAPMSAATTTSRPVLSCPSTCTATLSLSPLATSACWTSDSPVSQGAPA